METKTKHELDELPPRVRSRFLPLRKGALALAIGIGSGGLLFLVTAYHLCLRPGVPEHFANHPFEGDPVGHLWLLRQFFPGYDPVTWTGALAGLGWGLGIGFAVGFAIAAVRNTVLASWLLLVRARSNLAANRSFLDQI